MNTYTSDMIFTGIRRKSDEAAALHRQHYKRVRKRPLDRIAARGDSHEIIQARIAIAREISAKQRLDNGSDVE